MLRKIFSEEELAGEIGKQLLTPTRIYVKPILKLLKSVNVEGIVNITGGGFVDNLPRVLPPGLGASINKGSWPRPKIFDLVRDSGNISEFEMARTFNMGIGMVLILKPRLVKKAQQILKSSKCPSWVMGEIKKQKVKVELI